MMIRNIVLAILLLTQVTLWLLLDSPLKEEAPRSEPIDSKRLSDLPLASVTAIEYSDSSGKSVTLRQRNGRWIVESLLDFPVVKSRTEKILEAFDGLSRAEFRSEKKSLHENFDVDARKAQRVRFFGSEGALLGEYFIGKRDIQGIQGTFVRESRSDDVFVARSQDMGSLFSTDPYFWVSRLLFDVDMTDQTVFLDIKNACYRLEIEGRQPVRDPATGVVAEPPQFTQVRYVYERVDGASTSEEPTWKVVEPDNRQELVLGDLQVKTIVQNLLSVQFTTLVASASRPEHGFGDQVPLECRVTARFRQGDGDVSRTIEIGSEFEGEAVAGRPPQKQRYARARFPGRGLTDDFVFGLPAHYPMIFLREPESLAKVQAPKTMPPSSQPSGNR